MTGWAILTMFLITEVDFMQRLFGTTELSLSQWLICAAAGSVVLWVVEVVKFCPAARGGGRRSPPPGYGALGPGGRTATGR